MGVSVRAELPVEDLTVVLREAAAQDVPAIVQLLAADQLGAAGDGAPPTQTAALHARVRSDPQRSGAPAARRH